MSFDPQKAIREQQEVRRSQSWFLTKIHEFNAAHNQLKHHVHTAYRYPLPPWGRAVMGLVYFSIPVVVGYAVSSWVVSRAESTVDERLNGDGKLKLSVTGIAVGYLALFSLSVLIFQRLSPHTWSSSQTTHSRPRRQESCQGRTRRADRSRWSGGLGRRRAFSQE